MFSVSTLYVLFPRASSSQKMHVWWIDYFVSSSLVVQEYRLREFCKLLFIIFHNKVSAISLKSHPLNPTMNHFFCAFSAMWWCCFSNLKSEGFSSFLWIWAGFVTWLWPLYNVTEGTLWKVHALTLKTPMASTLSLRSQRLQKIFGFEYWWEKWKGRSQLSSYPCQGPKPKGETPEAVQLQHTHHRNTQFHEGIWTRAVEQTIHTIMGGKKQQSITAMKYWILGLFVMQ